MFYACAARFDVMENLVKFWVLFTFIRTVDCYSLSKKETSTTVRLTDYIDFFSFFLETGQWLIEMSLDPWHASFLSCERCMGRAAERRVACPLPGLPKTEPTVPPGPSNQCGGRVDKGYSSYLGLFGYCRIYLNPHVLEWIGVEFNSSSTLTHPNICGLI